MNRTEGSQNHTEEFSPEILSILLKDRSSQRNLIWATDNYIRYGRGYGFSDSITLEKMFLPSGSCIIRPRTEKSKEEQQKRIKEKAEVFTPSWICNKQNNMLDAEWFGRSDVFNTENGQSWATTTAPITFPEGKTWRDYISLRALEITCGEAPYLTSRYDTTTGEAIAVPNRIGILDRKLRVVTENTSTEQEWYSAALDAFRSTYGYEWQGDSLFIARQNLLQTFVDCYVYRFGLYPIREYLLEVAEIISWNLWQMDGLKCVIPNSCVKKKLPLQYSIFPEDNVEKDEPCLGCLKGGNYKHTGIYSKIMNWQTKRCVKFANLRGAKNMKFDFVIGNPPYQGENHQQVYPNFYLSASSLGNFVDLIFPIGWQDPKKGNNLGKLNTAEIKEDKQIVSIDNRRNVFSGVAGAEWTNIILWKKNYDNGLSGQQLILTDGQNPQIKRLLWNKQDIKKPEEIVQLVQIVTSFAGFDSLQKKTSVRKPYGLSTDVLKDYRKYGLEPFWDKPKSDKNIKIYCKAGIIKYVPHDYALPKYSIAFTKYKIFVAYAWGNMSETTGLGGAYSDIILAKPYDVCTETYQESGCFDNVETAKKHAKYLLTKFARACLYVNKTSRHSTTAWGGVPQQDYSESWWNLSITEINDKLFEKYQVPQNIREFVNNNFQTKDETNIVNFAEVQ